MNRTTLVEQLRHLFEQSRPEVTSSGRISAVRPDSVDVYSTTGGTTLLKVPVLGGAGGLTVGDPLYLLHTHDGQLLGLSPKQVAAGSPISVATTHSHDDLYYEKPEDLSLLGGKADLAHTHIPPDVITATGGTIGGWRIGLDDLSNVGVSLGRFGYLGLGPAAAVPVSYGNSPGVFLGYNTVSDLAQASLYSDANNYLQWTGTKLLVKAANFTLDASGNITASNVTLTGTITATAGSLGHWLIASDKIQSVSGSIVMDADAETIAIGAGLILDGGGQRILVGSTNPRILIDGSAHAIQTNTFSAGVTGWQVKSGNGSTIPDSAEFENLTARGEFRASVLAIGELHALGGSFAALGAGALAADVAIS